MRSYLNIVEDVLVHGEERETRNGKTRSLFGTSITHDLQEGFPLLTTKEMRLQSVVSELIWILSGSRDERYLARLNGTDTTIWTANADSYQGEFPGDVGHIYGPKLRHFFGVDQLSRLVETLDTEPTSRRMLVTMFDPSEVRQCLPVCHDSWQVYVREGKYLDLMWRQRSVDVGLGLPYDLAHYALLVIALASTVKLIPGVVSGVFGDTHIYEEHASQLQRQVDRIPYELPILILRQGATVFDLKIEDFTLLAYNPHSKLKMEMIV